MIQYIKKDLSELNNIGDILCTPDNYFNIASEDDLNILGGGSWKGYNIKRLIKANVDVSKTIAWGIGESIKDLTLRSSVDRLPFLEWSLRDRDLLSNKDKFVPCVSCLNRKILKEPINNNTFIFLNANTKVGPSKDKISSHNNFIGTNAECEDVFLSKWQHSDTIITNSYHGIYWALLSGRRVLPFGYSSKFVSLFEIFNLEFPLENYYRLEEKDIIFEKIKNQNKFIEVSDYKIKLENFQESNLQFAEKLIKYGINCKLK